MKKILLTLSLFFLVIPSGCSTVNLNGIHTYTISTGEFTDEWISISCDGKYIFGGYLGADFLETLTGMVNYYSPNETLTLTVEVSYRDEHAESGFIKKTESKEFFRSNGVYFEIRRRAGLRELEIEQSKEPFLYVG